jgi:hypothetical protein
MKSWTQGETLGLAAKRKTELVNIKSLPVLQLIRKDPVYCGRGVRSHPWGRGLTAEAALSSIYTETDIPDAGA